MTIVDILKAAVENGTSDIHLAVGVPPMIRLVGDMMELPGFPALDAETCKNLIYSVLFDDQKAKFEEHLELDCSLQVKGLSRFRVNVMVQNNGVEAVFRVVPDALPTADKLGIGPALMNLADLPSGLVLVTGPTGSGKSTTLACMLDHINQKQRKHIITIEDPIEFVHTNKQSLIRQRGVGPHTHSFQDALRHALRQDPDVIMVGELRDLESMALAVTAAETGHLCFATLHTGDAASTVNRIIDVFPEGQQQQIRIQLAANLKAVVSQILVSRSDGQGRVAAREVMVVTPGVSNLIREGKTQMIQGAIETGGKFNMYSMDQCLAELARKGLITEKEAAASSRNPAARAGQKP